MAYSFNKNNGFNNSGASLPVSGYVCKIIAAPRYEVWDENQKKYVEAKTFESATRTVVPFDIAEGEYASFYQKKFNEDESTEKKWKGSLVLRHPTDADKYDTNERRYNSFGAALMDSNPSFDFDINKNKACKDLMLGIVFREKEFLKDNGEMGVFAEPYSTYSVDDIRSGNYKIPKRALYRGDKPAASTSSAIPSWCAVEDNTDAEIPF